MHDCDWRVEPGQAPHVLVRVCCPVPQLIEHVPQFDQALDKKKALKKYYRNKKKSNITLYY